LFGVERTCVTRLLSILPAANKLKSANGDGKLLLQ
jgi:hypothetical protein